MSEFTLTDTEASVIRAVQRKGGRVWAVGGCIRDLLLGLSPKDIDLVTNLPPPLSSGAVAELGLKVIDDKTAWSHGIIRIGTHQGIVDLATLRKDLDCDGRHATIEFADTIEEDLQRRDLTINAMAAEIDEEGNLGEIIDMAGGVEDLNRKRIRFVGKPEQRITEDSLRQIRACRFTALGEGWEISDFAKSHIRGLSPSIRLVSKERIRDEIFKALAYPKPSNFFRSLADCELLVHTMPLLHDAIGVDGGEYHDETVFDHLMYALDAAVSLTDDVLLRMAALLHDCGKPGTRTISGDGRAHFYKHEIQGMILADEWMKEYKFSNKERAYVTKLVRHHQWRFMPDSKDKTIRRWLRDVGQEWKDLITLRTADRMGNLAKRGRSTVTKPMRELMERAQQIIDSGEPIFDGDLAINGNDFKDIGIPPGPIYGDIFKDIWSLVIKEPEKNTKEELLKVARRKYDQRCKTDH